MIREAEHKKKDEDNKRKRQKEGKEGVFKQKVHP